LGTAEERIASLEAKVEGQEKWLRSIDDKLDTLIAAMNMGRGAWYLLLKIGAFIVAAATVISWLSDRLILPK
jgi:hypothetical protein